jgi:uncharacterized membrane protein YjjB (DUF3815 family)
MAPAKDSLLPSPTELARLNDAVAARVIEAVIANLNNNHRYALTGMICGTASFLGCVGAYVYLVVEGHPKAATVALGAAVLSVIGRMLAARL